MRNVISRTCFALTIIGFSLVLSSCGYNTIPTLQEQAKARWSDVAFNTALRTFPTVIWAKTAFSGEKPMAEFTAATGAATPPQVKF